MILSDNHMHTTFSADGKSSPEEMVEASIKKGLKCITLTDHLDIDYPDDPDMFLLDFTKYIPKVLSLKERYASDIEILLGVEIGLQPQLCALHQSIISSYPFDFVIGSLHVVHGVDPYYEKYYEGRSTQEGHREFFECTLENIKAFHDFDSLGHLDYVVRYGAEKDAGYSYEKYADIIDVILKALIVEDIALEVNTGSIRKGLSHPNPTEGIIKKYIELGGTKLTVGADAHGQKDVAADYDVLMRVFSECGVDKYCIFKKREPFFVNIDPA